MQAASGNAQLIDEQRALSRLDLNLLVLFDALWVERHVGRAAQRLHLSPSAVSHGLARLRKMLDDPLFVKHAHGMLPTDRASAQQPRIRAILSQVRAVVETAAPFAPSAARRRFCIGAADGFGGHLSALAATLDAAAPGIELRLHHLRPGHALQDLDQQVCDMVVAPFASVPPRFMARHLYDEQYVLAMRTGHPYAQAPSLEAYCAARHLLVSPSGDMRGAVDELLAAQGRTRRVALTAPNFFLSMQLLGGTDLLAVLPLSFVRRHAAYFSVQYMAAPIVVPPSPVQALTLKSAAGDAGLAWLLELAAGAAS
ncbi:MAG TPA: LysR substrate-binding domain-containing protein [Burkholderiaceae bacterium]